MQTIKVSLSVYNKIWVPVLERVSSTSTTKEEITETYKIFGLKYLATFNEQHYFGIVNYKKWFFSKLKHGL